MVINTSTPPPPPHERLEPWQLAAAEAYARSLGESGEDWLKHISAASVWLIAERDHLIPADLKESANRPLQFQCEALDVEIDAVPIQRRDRRFISRGDEFPRKEDAVAHWYTDQWTAAKFDEGETINLILELLYAPTANTIGFSLGFQLDPPSDLNAFSHQFRRYFLNFDRYTILSEKLDSVMEDFNSIEPSHMLSPGALEACIVDRYGDEEEPYDQSAYFLQYAPFARILLHEAPCQFWRDILNFKLRYGPSSGWPDVTLIRPGRVGLCEVKDKDRIHASQLAWWHLQRPLLADASCWVAKLV